MSLEFIERLLIRLLVKQKLAELHGNSFETFFQDLMALRRSDFADVRTAGRLGDQGSDGLLLHGEKLFACYAPEVFDEKEVKNKLESDLAKALTKRKGQFKTFCFVNNDLRGMHPKISSELVFARQRNPDIQFEIWGFRRIRDEITKLTRDQVEDLLAMPLPVADLVLSVTLEELAPLLEHLRENRTHSGDAEPIAAVSQDKLDFNEFDEETKEDLRRSMVRSADIDRYYQARIDVTERDEVAQRFNDEYHRIRQDTTDPEECLWYLEQFILGNASQPITMRRGASAIIAYFLQTCDIFENPPQGWDNPNKMRESA